METKASNELPIPNIQSEPCLHSEKKEFRIHQISLQAYAQNSRLLNTELLRNKIMQSDCSTVDLLRNNRRLNLAEINSRSLTQRTDEF